MRAAIYRRVSTQAQVTGGASLDEQREAAEGYAAARGWSLAGDYVEAGRSAFAEDVAKRPALQRLLDDAKRRAFDVVLVYDLSRLARRQRVAFAVGYDLEKLGVRVVSVTESAIDTSTVEGFIAFSMLTMQAELHSRMLSRRMTHVRAREAAQGRLMTKPPRGYRWVDGAVVVDEEAAELVRRLFLWAGELGMTGPAIQRRLAEMGEPITRSNLDHILTNVAYTGRLVHRGRVLPAVWEPIISRELFDKVQAARAGRRPDRAVRNVVRTKRPALLAGLVFCAGCGAKLWHDPNAAPRRNYYRCSRRQDTLALVCAASACREDDLDAQTADLIAALTVSEELIAQAAAAVRALVGPAPVRPNPEAIAERLRRLARAYADGAYTDAEYEAERRALEALLREPATAPTLDLEASLSLLRDLPALWASGTTASRRALLAALFSELRCERHRIVAARPTAAAAPILASLWDGAVLPSWSQKGHSPIVLIATP